MFSRIFFFSLFLAFQIHPLEFFIESSPSFSEFFIYNTSTAWFSPSLPNFDKIQIAPLPNDKFCLSWLDSTSDQSNISINAQIFDSNTIQPLFDTPIVLNGSVYNSPMIISALFFPQEGIMAFWSQKDIRDISNHSHFHLLGQSFYLNAKFNSNQNPSIIAYDIDEELANSLGKKSFKAIFINTDYDGFYVVSWLHMDIYSKRYKIYGLMVRINYCQFPQKLIPMENYSEITSFSIFPLQKNGFIWVYVAKKTSLDDYYSIYYNVLRFDKYMVNFESGVQNITSSNTTINFLYINSIQLKNKNNLTDERERYYLVIWQNNGIHGQLLNDFGSKIGSSFQLKSLLSSNPIQITPFGEDSIIFFYELIGEDVNTRNYYEGTRIALNGTEVILESMGNGSFLHPNGNLQKAFPLQKRALIFLLFSDQKTVFGKYFKYNSDQNCLVYDNDTLECDQCNEGYFLSMSHLTCFPNITNCMTPDAFTGICQNCFSPYKLTKNMINCVKNIENCVDFNDNGTCFICNETYNATISGNFCVPTIKICSLYDDSGLCLLCANHMAPISSDINQCLNIYVITVSSDKDDLDFNQKFTSTYVFQSTFIVSWLDGKKNNNQISAQAILLETSSDRFLFSGSIKNGNGDVYDSEDPEDDYFMKKTYEEIIYPIQTITSTKDQLTIFAIWSYYRKSRFNLYLANIYLDESPIDFFLLCDIPMLIDDFEFNGYTHSIKKMSNGIIVVFWAIKDSIRQSLSIHGAIYDPSSLNPINFFEIIDESMPSRVIFKLEVLESNVIVLCYLINKPLIGDFISLSTYRMTRHHELSKIASNEIGPFTESDLKTIELLKKKDDFVVFWQNDGISYQQFDLLCASQIPKTILNTQQTHVFSLLSACTLADDRWVIVWGNNPQNETNGSFLNFKIEGDDNLHSISKNKGLNPTVTCKEDINLENQTSSFIIAWSNTSDIDKKTRYMMILLVAKQLQYCQEYYESMQQCKKCNSDAITTQYMNQTLCWKEIIDCQNYSNDTGVCEQCKGNGTKILVDSNGKPQSYNSSQGYICVDSIQLCSQYDLKTSNFPCAQCESNYKIIDDICVHEVVNCEDETKEGICKICKVPYRLQNKKCLQNIDRCTTLSEETETCEKCDENFIQIDNNKSCALYVENCVAYNPTTLNCDGCSEGYSRNGNECEKSFNSVIIIILTVIPGLIIIGLLGRRFYLYRRIKRLEKRDDSNLTNLIFEKRKELIMSASLLDDPSKFQAFINKANMSSNINCYELLGINDNFSKKLQIKKKTFIGQGGVGQVWKVFDREGDEYVLKIFINESRNFDENDINHYVNMAKEYRTLENLHDGIIKVRGIGYSDKEGFYTVGILLEPMDEDLFNFMKKNGNLGFEKKLNIAIQITKSLSFIHDKEYKHHDVKMGNILLKKEVNDEYKVKVSDFGSCTKKNPFDESEEILTGITNYYSAPENILHCRFGSIFEDDKRSDIWSLGIVFYHIFIKSTKSKLVFPWSHLDTTDHRFKTKVLEEKNQAINQYLNREMVGHGVLREIIDLINKCLQVDLQRRPLIEEILGKLNEIREGLSPNIEIL